MAQHTLPGLHVDDKRPCKTWGFCALPSGCPAEGFHVQAHLGLQSEPSPAAMQVTLLAPVRYGRFLRKVRRRFLKNADVHIRLRVVRAQS